MCTAISYKTNDHYFGRNLDLEYCYHEAVTITPRNFQLHFRETKSLKNHYAIIGMATVSENYPLYYDATNEHGLSAAGLNFPGNAVYLPTTDGKENIAPFELIPWVLAQFKTVDEAEKRLRHANIANIAFSDEFPNTSLHWIIADKRRCIVVETDASGIQIHENPVGVLTNSPPFPYHMYHLCDYLNVTREEAVNRFTDKLQLTPYSRGMGGMGLPGDLSSASRFVRAAFTKLNSVCDTTENESITQFFHILDSVAQIRGCVKVKDAYEITVYSSCCNTDKGIYYYKTYTGTHLVAVQLQCENLDSCDLISYPLQKHSHIHYENEVSHTECNEF